MGLFHSCKDVKTEITYNDPDLKIIFLHHSTGNNVWYGDVNQYARIRLKEEMAMVPRLIKEYNEKTGRRISIQERAFPSGDPYPWKNYPYDYYNIWVKNAGSESYMGEPTLEMLTKEYDIIVFKFCFPYSNILPDDGNPDIDSEIKTIANYKLQYNALKEKILEFPETEFIVWTGAALVESATTEENAKRAQEITQWVKNNWDAQDDNITVFDFRHIETDGGLFLKPEYTYSEDDSHPNMVLSEKAAKAFVDSIIGVIEAK